MAKQITLRVDVQKYAVEVEKRLRTTKAQESLDDSPALTIVAKLLDAVGKIGREFCSGNLDKRRLTVECANVGAYLVVLISRFGR